MSEKTITCGKCHKHQAMHHQGSKHLCCECWVREGNPPADWHSVCMKVYASLRKENATP